MKNFENHTKLNRDFYLRNVLDVAKDLLGKTFIRNDGKNLLAGTIVEVEAYDEIEEASHSFNGLSSRNEVMFEKGGFLYVYLIYGIHYCCNVVTGEKGHGAAVLIRGIEPFDNFNILSKNRYGRIFNSEFEKLNLTNGPAKLCQAFNINKINNGENLTGENIYILNSSINNNFVIIQSSRVGISKAKDLPWRFYIKDNRFVSRSKRS